MRAVGRCISKMQGAGTPASAAPAVAAGAVAAGAVAAPERPLIQLVHV